MSRPNAANTSEPATTMAPGRAHDIGSAFAMPEIAPVANVTPVAMVDMTSAASILATM